MTSSRCPDCSDKFNITESDREFYQKLDVPLPKQCPDCRQRLRVMHINQFRLFKRKCSATEKSIITSHPPYVPYPVHDLSHWYSDAVDNTEHGQEIDFSRPFFEQFAELSNKAAKPALFVDFTRDENSAYTNYAGQNKNCYLIFDSDQNWDCLYSYGINSCKNSLDCFRGDKLELCYEAIDSSNCYACHYIQDCSECSESSYLKSCISARNSLFCANLYQKENYILNKPATKNDVIKLKEALKDQTVKFEYIKKYEELLRSLPDRAVKGVLNEDCIGNYLFQCKNAHLCFDSRNVWDGSYIYQAFLQTKNSMDCHEVGEGELLYQCSEVGYNAFNCKFVMNCLNQLSDLTYCDFCFLGCHHLFGCIGLKKKEYCILNKQYSKEEYFNLKDKLIAHMKKTKEWGEFFPASLSPFAYNHSLAQTYYPLSKEDASTLGIRWEDETKESSDIASDELTKKCSKCSANFKLVPQEIKYYELYSLEHPKDCFLCRNKQRLNKRADRMVLKQTCDCCKKELQAPRNKNGVKIYCDLCFAQARI